MEPGGRHSADLYNQQLQALQQLAIPKQHRLVLLEHLEQADEWPEPQAMPLPIYQPLEPSSEEAAPVFPVRRHGAFSFEPQPIQ